MPILTPIQGELLVACVTIGYGIAIEKWFVSRASILANVFTWLVLIFTVDLSPLILLIMIIWLMIGLAIVWEDGKGGIKQLFGSKVFGSLALVLGINHWGGWNIPSEWLLVVWVIIGGLVFALGKKYNDGW